MCEQNQKPLTATEIIKQQREWYEKCREGLDPSPILQPFIDGTIDILKKNKLL